MENYPNDKACLQIIDCIKKAHSFSINLGGSSSITREFIVNDLIDFSPTDVHIELLKLNDEGKLIYNSETGVITEINM